MHVHAAEGAQSQHLSVNLWDIGVSNDATNVGRIDTCRIIDFFLHSSRVANKKRSSHIRRVHFISSMLLLLLLLLLQGLSSECQAHWSPWQEPFSSRCERAGRTS